MAESFLSKDCSIKDIVVDYIDNDKTNNKVENLRYISRTENSIKQFIDNGTHKLTEDDVRWIRKNKGIVSLKNMCKKFNLSSTNSIVNIYNGISYRYIE